MNLQAQLDQFREDAPYDVDTQARRLYATDDKDLILYVLALGLSTAKHRQRHSERDYIKNMGEAPQLHKVRMAPGRGTFKTIPIKPSKKMEQLTKQLIFDVWTINEGMKLGDASANDLAVAINRESRSAAGHARNIAFYDIVRSALKKDEVVRDRWSEKALRSQIEEVYGEFRKSEAA